MESYIVRIYSYEKNEPRSFVGVVEEVGITRRKAFKNLGELWDILTSKNEKPFHVNKDRKGLDKFDN